MFDRIDTGQDRRIDWPEFQRAHKEGMLRKWGFSNEDPKKIFDDIDKNRGGQILFDEFADYAIKHKLDLEDDDDADVLALLQQTNDQMTLSSRAEFIMKKRAEKAAAAKNNPLK